MSISVSRSVPDELSERTGKAEVEFSTGGRRVVITSRTGYSRMTNNNDVIVILAGEIYRDDASEESLGSFETYEKENKLRENRPGWYAWIAKVLNAERPTSFEEFFDEFVGDLGSEIGVDIHPSEAGDAFDRLADELISQDAFSTERGEGNYKPYCRVYRDRSWLDSVQE